jgi:hypothetical protein
MTRPVRCLAPLVLLVALTACHTDPFSVKPEVPGVEAPDKSPEAADASGKTEEAKP